MKYFIEIMVILAIVTVIVVPCYVVGEDWDETHIDLLYEINGTPVVIMNKNGNHELQLNVPEILKEGIRFTSIKNESAMPVSSSALTVYYNV